MLSLFAAAKINLSLTVLGRQPDGYHQLESLVAFADIGDRLFVKKAEKTALSVVGPFSGGLTDELSDELAPSNNLVLRALSLLEEAVERPLPTDIVLEKNLPVASGIGGGSADAAAALRGLMVLHKIATLIDDKQLVDLAGRLGADVPVCLDTSPAWMSGIGHDVSRPIEFPDADIVLVNPRIEVSTAEIFSALKAGAYEKPKCGTPSGFATPSDLLDFLKARGNDLQKVASSLAPDIEACLSGLAKAGAAYHAMSGSGATCFAICPPGQGKTVVARYRTFREKDWVVSGRLISAGNGKIDKAD